MKFDELLSSLMTNVVIVCSRSSLQNLGFKVESNNEGETGAM